MYMLGELLRCFDISGMCSKGMCRSSKVEAEGSRPLGHMTRLGYVMCHVMVYELSHMLSSNIQY